MSKLNIRLGLIAVGAAALLVGCSQNLTWTQTRTVPRPMSSRAADSVQVFHDNPPPRPHVEVGVIAGQKRRSPNSDTRGKLTEQMRTKAASLGCDAIFVRDVSPAPKPGSKKQPPLSLEGGCLIWTGDAASPEASPPYGPGGPTPAVGALPLDPSGLSVRPPEATPGAACANDMQCKGNRICENGRCVAPPAPSAGASSVDAGAASPPTSGLKCDMDVDCPGDEICLTGGCRRP